MTSTGPVKARISGGVVSRTWRPQPPPSKILLVAKRYHDVSTFGTEVAVRKVAIRAIAPSANASGRSRTPTRGLASAFRNVGNRLHPSFAQTWRHEQFCLYAAAEGRYRES